jgi:cobalt-zinc-cadmium efflux system membrane fusion protein
MTGHTKFVIVAALVLGAAVAWREMPLGSGQKKSAEASHGTHGGGGHGEKKNADDGHGHSHSGAEGGGEGFVKLSAKQIDAAHIEIAPSASGTLIKEINVPGRISINADRQAKIVSRLPGTVISIRKRMGESVVPDEVLAVLESREMADAQADYLASWRAEELARSMLVREDRLWKLKVTSEQDYLNARNAQQSAKIKLDLAHQRLRTMGLSQQDINGISSEPDADRARYYDIRTPIAGRVTHRTLVLGQSVGIDKDIFTVADLSTVWVEMAISPNDLPFAKEGQDVRIRSGANSGNAKVVTLSPVIDPDTRSAKAIAQLDNADGQWRLGDFVSALLVAGEQEVEILVPRDAVQDIKGQKAVFVNEDGGFKMRPVTLGREDSLNVEVLKGLEFGESIAIRNTFLLKAELGKSEAEHEH